MKRKAEFFKTRIFLILFTSTLFMGCQKDDNSFELQTIEESDRHSEQITRTVSVDDIPKIMDYLSTKCNSRGQFTINLSSNIRSNESDLVIGELQTKEIIQVTDQYDRSNYTFLLTSIVSNDSNVKSTFNLIVKESSSGLLSYITEYRPDVDWVSNYRNTQDFSTFTGEVLHYSIEGKYIAKLNLNNGVATSGETRSPCPENDTPEGNNGNNGEGESTSDGNTSDGNTSDGNNGNNNDDAPVDVTGELKWLCNWRGQLHNGPTECNNPGEGGTWVILITYGDKSVEETLRCPEDDAPIECHEVNGDPCPHGCNADGTGCLEIEENTNDIVGVIPVDLELVFAIDELIAPDELTSEQVDWIFESEGNIAFTELALEVLENGGEVDFDDKIIYDFVDKPCQKDIIKTTLSLSSDFINLITNTFDSNERTNLNLSTTDIPTGDYAFTIPFISGEQSAYYVDIRFDNTYLNNATDLSISAITLHELVHAYFVNLFVTNQMSSESDSFNDLLNAFIGFYENQVPDTSSTLDNEIHNAMNDFIDNASTSLFNYAQEKDIDVDLEYCNNLMWGTMFGTELFEEVLTEDQQTSYGNIAAIEHENVTFEGQSPKGLPCE